MKNKTNLIILYITKTERIRQQANIQRINMEKLEEKIIEKLKNGTIEQMIEDLINL